MSITFFSFLDHYFFKRWKEIHIGDPLAEPHGITGEGVQINSNSSTCSLSSESSKARHSYSDTGQPFIMVISEDLWYSHCRLAFGSGPSTTCFNDFGLFRPRYPPCKANVLLLRRRGYLRCISIYAYLFGKIFLFFFPVNISKLYRKQNHFFYLSYKEHDT